MSKSLKLGRIFTLASSMALMVGYVIYSQVTPNIPPPDPFGLNGTALTLAPEVIEFDSFINYGTPVSQENRSSQELRIISSKAILQPVFSTRKSASQPIAQMADSITSAPYLRSSFWSCLFGTKTANQQPAVSTKPSQELRIISSKVINQPIFSVRSITWEFSESQNVRDPFVRILRPYSPPHQERVGTWFPGYEMTGLSLDALRRPTSDMP